VHDRYLNGEPEGAQPITEMPVFSFVLSDIHPHVAALPFALLAIGLSLNLVLGKRDLWWYEYPIYAICVGGMIFLNSWDAVYLALLIGAEVLRRWIRGRGQLTFEDLWRSALFAVIMVGLTLAFYLPWLITFSSQASGLLPNVIYPTPWQQFFLQFGAFLIILTLFLLTESTRGRFNVQAGLLVLSSAIMLAGILLLVLGSRAWDDPQIRGTVYKMVGEKNLSDIMPKVLDRRLIGLPTEILLLVMIFIVVGRLFSKPASDPDEVLRVTYSPATGFALLLIGMGAVLTFVPDFVYLRDNFGARMNTVFKLYYQGWIVFSVAGAFAVWSIVAGNTERRTQPNPVWIVPRAAFLVVMLILLIAGMSYGVLAGRGRAFVNAGRLCSGDTCNQPELTLNGEFTIPSSPDEYAAIQCLDRLEPTDDNIVLVEAPFPGGYHPEYSRFSGLTGIPTLMGWEGHEGQWRGNTYPEVTDRRVENGRVRDRISDVQDLYTTQDWDEAWAIIDRYGIDYIVVGGAEHSMVSSLANQNMGLLNDYTRGLEKFERVLQPVCEYGSTVVYRVTPS
jgi:YYY domain-containing protein